MKKKEAISLLNLSNEYTPQDIRRAYKRRALELHPDRKNGMASQFIKLKEAHDFLLSAHCESYSSIDIHGEINIHREIEKLIEVITQQYKDAIIPFILALPSEKQQWMIHFIELYGKFILEESEYNSILTTLQKESVGSGVHVVDTTENSILIYIDEIIRDQVIIQQNEYIPSWVLEWNGKLIHRNKVNDVELSENNLLTFIIRKPIKNIYHSDETIQLNRSYFSGSNIIHIICSVQKSDLRITPDVQYPEFEMKCFTIYNSKGKVIWTHKENDFRGCIHPSVGLDDIHIRTPYCIGLHLTL